MLLAIFVAYCILSWGLAYCVALISPLRGSREEAEALALEVIFAPLIWFLAFVDTLTVSLAQLVVWLMELAEQAIQGLSPLVKWPRDYLADYFLRADAHCPNDPTEALWDRPSFDAHKDDDGRPYLRDWTCSCGTPFTAMVEFNETTNSLSGEKTVYCPRCRQEVTKASAAYRIIDGDRVEETV